MIMLLLIVTAHNSIIWSIRGNMLRFVSLKLRNLAISRVKSFAWNFISFHLKRNKTQESSIYSANGCSYMGLFSSFVR